MNPNLLPEEIPPHALTILEELDYQDRYWAALCDYWQAVAEYRALLVRGGMLN